MLGPDAERGDVPPAEFKIVWACNDRDEATGSLKVQAATILFVAALTTDLVGMSP
jgi:hypothetical protein